VSSSPPEKHCILLIEVDKEKNPSFARSNMPYKSLFQSLLNVIRLCRFIGDVNCGDIIDNVCMYEKLFDVNIFKGYEECSFEMVS